MHIILKLFGLDIHTRLRRLHDLYESQKAARDKLKASTKSMVDMYNHFSHNKLVVDDDLDKLDEVIVVSFSTLKELEQRMSNTAITLGILSATHGENYEVAK